MNPLRLRAPLLALLALPLAPTRAAEDPCAAFSWDVHHERELFREQPVDIASARALAADPVVTPDRLSELELRAQPEVSFAAPPSRIWPKEATYAGLARLTVDTAGVYRFALDQPAWVDVVAGGAELQSRDAQGRV